MCACVKTLGWDIATWTVVFYCIFICIAHISMYFLKSFFFSYRSFFVHISSLRNIPFLYKLHLLCFIGDMFKLDHCHTIFYSINCNANECTTCVDYVDLLSSHTYILLLCYLVREYSHCCFVLISISIRACRLRPLDLVTSTASRFYPY